MLGIIMLCILTKLKIQTSLFTWNPMMIVLKKLSKTDRAILNKCWNCQKCHKKFPFIGIQFSSNHIYAKGWHNFSCKIRKKKSFTTFWKSEYWLLNTDCTHKNRLFPILKKSRYNILVTSPFKKKITFRISLITILAIFLPIDFCINKWFVSLDFHSIRLDN